VARCLPAATPTGKFNGTMLFFGAGSTGTSTIGSLCEKAGRVSRHGPWWQTLIARSPSAFWAETQKYGYDCQSDGHESDIISPTEALKYKPVGVPLPLILLNSRPLFPWAVSRIKEALSASVEEVQRAAHPDASGKSSEARQGTLKESFQLAAKVQAAPSPAAGLESFVVGMATQRHAKHSLVLRSGPNTPLLDATTSHGLAILGTYLGLPQNVTLSLHAHQHQDVIHLAEGTAELLRGVLPRQSARPQRSLRTTTQGSITVTADEVAEVVAAALLNWQPLQPESKATFRELLEAHNWIMPAGFCACPPGTVSV